ncbi:MAG: hypothetical protein LBH25_01145 [Fibromonadaceae bacterium]|nr:hypothetical protein [Fibromonadaceae bacterium]
MKSIIRKILLNIAFFAKIVLASNEAGAYFVYDYGKMYEAEHKSKHIDLNAKVLLQNNASFYWNSTRIESDGGKIVLLSAAFPFSINSYVLEPAILLGKGFWEKWDFKYFYGRPSLPFALGFGMSLYRGPNSFSINYMICNGKIIGSQEETELFNSDFYIYHALYKFNASRNFNLYAGFAGLNAEATGVLTAENQGYFLFPYLFYEANGYMNVKAVYGMANLKLESASMEYGIDLGALVAVSEKVAGNLHYKYRKKFANYFGEEEIFEDFYPVRMKGSGIVFSILSVQTKKIRIGEKYIQYGIKKPLAIPFGKFFTARQEIDENGDFYGDYEDDSKRNILKDIFLLGLTAHASVYF